MFLSIYGRYFILEGGPLPEIFLRSIFMKGNRRHFIPSHSATVIKIRSNLINERQFSKKLNYSYVKHLCNQSNVNVIHEIVFATFDTFKSAKLKRQTKYQACRGEGGDCSPPYLRIKNGKIALKVKCHGRYHDFWPKFTKFKL